MLVADRHSGDAVSEDLYDGSLGRAGGSSLAKCLSFRRVENARPEEDF